MIVMIAGIAVAGPRFNSVQYPDYGLLGYWSFNEGGSSGGGDALDHSPLGNHLDLIGDTRSDPGQWGNALYFDGNGDYGDTGAKILASAPFTVLGWFRFGKANNADEIWGNDGGSTSQDGFHTSYGGDGKVYFVHSDGSAPANFSFSTSSTLGSNQWYFLAWTWDGSTDANAVQIWIDGAVDSSATASHSTINTPDYNLWIGEDGLASAGRYHTGNVDEFRIYNRLLTSAEINRLRQDTHP
jgi:sialidase-1